MALVKDVNALSTVEEASDYFTDRLDSSAWFAATPERQAQALVTASSMLSELNWAGYAVSESQELAFPRSGSYFDPRVGVLVDMTPTPKRILRAQHDLALHLLSNEGILDDTGTVDSLSITGVNLSNIRAPARIPLAVKNLVRPLLVNQGSNAWWRAN